MKPSFRELSILVLVLICFRLASQASSELNNVQFTEVRCFVGDMLQGKIYDSQTKEGLQYGIIGVKDTKVYASADSAGFFTLDLSSLHDSLNNLTIIASYINYYIKQINVDYFKARFLEVPMESKPGISCPEVSPLPSSNKGKYNPRNK